MVENFRYAEIIELAREYGKVTVEGLAQHFNVTPQTIRRDLNDLCEKGKLNRVHGGAVPASGTSNIGYADRRDISRDAKEKIGRLCASHVPDGASLFINIGTTTEAVARHLLQHRNLMVVTNNINVATTLAENPDAEIVLAGGVLRRSDGGLVGEATADFIRQFKLDIAIIGTSALDNEGTLLDYDYREVRVSRAIIANARQSFLVADHSKFERTAPVRIGDIEEIDSFFTDRPLANEAQDTFNQNNTKVFLPD